MCILKNVWLQSTSAIEQFIAAFDLDQNQRYLQSVKAIRVIPSDVPNNIVLDQKHITKLFFRFPNLEKVILDGLDLITNFNEDLCRSFLSHCPKLRTFDVNYFGNDPRSEDFLKKVQPLLTDFELSDYSELNTTEAVQFINQFSHLRTISCFSESLNSLELFFPILEQLSDVTTLYLGLDDDMEEDWETYLSARSQEARDQLTKSLSNITDLTFIAYSNINNTLQFMSQYFTDLNCLNVERDLEEWEPDEEQDLFCRRLFNLIPLVKDKCCIELQLMHFTSLVRNFSPLVQSVFQKVPKAYKQSKSRVLEISIRHGGFVPSHLVNLDVESRQSPFCRKVKIGIDQEYYFATLLENDALMDEVDVFVLRFDKDTSRRIASVSTRCYLLSLEAMPSLKQVILDVPSWYLETVQEGNESYSGPTLSLLEEATFNISVNGPTQALFDSCCIAFPNLKRLNINNSSGVWNATLGEFQLYLPNYSLERLTLDTNSLVKRMNQIFESMDAFFLLDVEIQSLCERRLYKISNDLSSHKLINSRDLKSLKRCADYLSLRLVVNSLAQMKLWWNKSQTETKSCIIILEQSE